MSSALRIAIAQLNFKVGDIPYNIDKHLKAAMDARDKWNADIILFPELSLIGYPCEDLLLRPSFIKDSKAALRKLINEIKDIYAVVGHPYFENNKLYNACSLFKDGKVIGRYAKQRLPNYGVFDEARYFTPGDKTYVTNIQDIPIALLICEDMWRIQPAKHAATRGAKIILSPNASPFEISKFEQRFSLLKKRATEHHINILYANLIGGQDDIVFDGGSLVMQDNGHLNYHLPFFAEAIETVDVNAQGKLIEKKFTANIPPKIERIYHALVLSVRDYVQKNNFSGVLVGVSGGIDSALTLTLAVDALGKDAVQAVMMPSRYTADISNIDGEMICNTLDVRAHHLSIDACYQSFLTTLKDEFANKTSDVTEENIQSRCRAILLMALANKQRNLVLTTGNRSELAVGYCTLYGDMAGAFAVLKDVPKTMVYELARYRNSISAAIPERTMTRAPTAELAPDQTDQDTLPPYDLLDEILHLYLNQGLSLANIIKQGYDAQLVKNIIDRIHFNEYKRKQGAIGPHLQHKSFNRDWRYPNTHGYKW